jgi:hypothetical protein
MFLDKAFDFQRTQRLPDRIARYIKNLGKAGFRQPLAGLELALQNGVTKRIHDRTVQRLMRGAYIRPALLTHHHGF